jgi:cyclase
MKNKCILVLCGLFCVFVNSVFAREMVKISDSVYAYIAGQDSAMASDSFNVNTGVIIGDNGVLVIDTLVSAKEAKKFINEIRKITNKPIKYAVNTHYHLDHAWGNSEFSKLGAIIISQENDKKSMEQFGPEGLKNINSFGLTDEDMIGTVITPASITFSNRMSIDLGAETVELLYLGTSHSSGSIVVVLPKEKVLFAGDALFTNFYPVIMDGNVASWVKVLDSIQKMDVKTIIPGHGPISGKKDVSDMKQFLILFDKNAKKLALTSNDPQKIALELKKILPKRSQLDWAIEENVKAMYMKKDKQK